MKWAQVRHTGEIRYAHIVLFEKKTSSVYDCTVEDVENI